MNFLLKCLSSKIVYRFAIFGWIIQGLYAIFFMAPSTDDGSYLIQSLSTFNHWVPGTWIGNHFHPVFFDMPTFPFLNGLFFKLLNLIGITPGIYTFRIFTLACLATLLILSIKFITKLTEKSLQNVYLVKNIFLISLAITPFALACWSVRPEILGLTTLLAALLFFLKASEKEKLIYWGFCGLFLGISAMVHPIMAIIAFVLGLGILLARCIERKFQQLFILIIFAAIPCLIFIVWFWFHKDTAISQLFYRTANVTSHSTNSHLRGIRYIFINMNPFSGDKGLLIGLYSAIFYLPLIPLTLIFIRLLFQQRLHRYSWKETLKNPRLWLPISFLISMMIILFNIKMYGPYLLDLSFLLMLSIACLLTNPVRYKKLTQPNNSKLYHLIPVSLIVLFIVCINTLAQTGKFFLVPNAYYQASTTNKQVMPKLKQNDKLIITGQRLLPAFPKLLIKPNNNKPQLHCVFCAGAGYLPSTLWKNEASDYIYNDLAKQDPKHLVWGVMKQDIFYRNKNKSLCFLLKGFLAPVLLSDGKIVFQDAENIFYRPEKMRIGKLGETCKQLVSVWLDH